MFKFKIDQSDRNMQKLFCYRQGYSRNHKHEVKDENIRSSIAQILGITSTNDWLITDHKNINNHNLYQVNFNTNSDLSKWGFLKGVVVDLEAKTRVSRSWGYTPGTISDEIISPNGNNLNFVDHTGQTHNFDLANTMIKPIFEGTIISIFKCHGEVHYSVNISMHAERSGKNHFAHIGNYKNLYYQLGGPREDILFNPGKENSPYTYTFLLARQELTSATKLECGNGFLSYLGSFCNWDPENPPYPHDSCELSPEFDEQHEMLTKEMPEYGVIEPFIYCAPNMSLEDANRHLRYGWLEPYDDTLINNYHRSGEGVVLINKTTGKTLYVYSSAYAWRRSIRGEEATIKQAFYVRTDDADLPDEEFNAKYPPMAQMDLWQCEQLIKDGKHILIWPHSIKNIGTDTYQKKLTIVWLSFLISCNPSIQVDAWNLLGTYYSDKHYLIDTILGYLKNNKKYDLPTNFKDLLFTVLNRTHNKANQTVDALTQIIDDELSGAELHRMVKYLKRQAKLKK